MAQIIRTTSGMVGPASSDLQATITSLKASIASGNAVTAAQINSLIGVWNSFNNHFHTVPDQWYLAFGNTYSYVTSYDNNPENTSAAAGVSADIGTTVSVGDSITAANHETLRSSILSANGHHHTIDDRTGP